MKNILLLFALLLGWKSVHANSTPNPPTTNEVCLEITSLIKTEITYEEWVLFYDISKTSHPSARKGISGDKRQSVHPDRTAGGHRDHRDPGRTAPAGPGQGQGKGPADHLRQQSEAAAAGS